jgi:hypothetical protein
VRFSLDLAMASWKAARYWGVMPHVEIAAALISGEVQETDQCRLGSILGVWKGLVLDCIKISGYFEFGLEQTSPADAIYMSTVSMRECAEYQRVFECK